jgi:hypothetical protein
MSILLIKNSPEFHLEIIESVIVKYKDIINGLKPEEYEHIKIHLLVNHKDKSFIAYIKEKYPHISFSNPNKYDYMIDCTFYDKDYNKIKKNSHKEYYVAHEITKRLKDLSNVYFLTPLANKYIIADVLPFFNNAQTQAISQSKVQAIPIYIIQGNLTAQRRNYSLLKMILEKTYVHNFKIKLLGRGQLPDILKPYKSKIILKNNLNFVNYSKEFLTGYCILPLITKKSHPKYYSTKLTSTINYARGYNLKCLIDKDLQNIYHLENAAVFNSEKDVVSVFTKTLEDFYAKK